MSWVVGGAAATLEELVDVRPGLLRDFDHIRALLWSSDTVPVVTLELARLRVAMLLRCDAELVRRTPEAIAAGLDEQRVAALPRWPTDAAFSTGERACLAFAEQFVIDAKGVTDADVDALREALGDAGAVAFAVAMALFEGQTRAVLALGAVAPQEE